jgi:hypothetical protein
MTHVFLLSSLLSPNSLLFHKNYYLEIPTAVLTKCYSILCIRIVASLMFSKILGIFPFPSIRISPPEGIAHVDFFYYTF